MQMPQVLPVDPQCFLDTKKKKKQEDDSGRAAAPPPTSCAPGQIPGGTSIGKLVVYEDESVELKIGDVVFNVEPGTDVTVAHELIQQDPRQKTSFPDSVVFQKATVVPDVSGILNKGKDDRMIEG